MRNTLFSIRTFVAVLGLTLASASLAAAQAPAARTAGEQYKSVTALKDISANQLIPSMRFMSTALGVECEYCHMGDRTVETPGKATARRMIAMMKSINETSFAGRREVTCFTCHHGSIDPETAPAPNGEYSKQGVAPFFQPNGGPLPGPRDTIMVDAYKGYMAKNALAGMPTTDQILAKYVAALGGEAALRKITSRAITATAQLAGDVRGAQPDVHVPMQYISKAPNQWVMTFGTGNTANATGFDGNVAWIQGANGNVTEATAGNNAPTPPLARVRRNADFYEPLNLKQQYTQLALRGVERINNRDAYLLVGTPAGDLPEYLYFDTQTGLLVRKVTAVTTGVGDYSIRTDYSDYRELGGVKTPFLVENIGVSPADEFRIHVEKIDFNPTIDAARFAKPAARPQQPAAR